MGDTSTANYAARYPVGGAAVDERVRAFVSSFYAISDDASRDGEWVGCFAPGASLVMGERRATGVDGRLLFVCLRGRVGTDGDLRIKHGFPPQMLSWLTLRAEIRELRRGMWEKGGLASFCTAEFPYFLRTSEVLFFHISHLRAAPLTPATRSQISKTQGRQGISRGVWTSGRRYRGRVRVYASRLGRHGAEMRWEINRSMGRARSPHRWRRGVEVCALSSLYSFSTSLTQSHTSYTAASTQHRRVKRRSPAPRFGTCS
ncbi:hypothetical protein F4802DRAFT_549069 [Xylaria palmicola]|nr:hypothetical protein F4802DRAFT_549069 [Xylaria palmicola]